MQQPGSKYFARKYTHAPWGQSVKTCFILIFVMSQIKLKGMEIEHNARKYYVPTHTLDPWGRSKGELCFHF